MAKNVIYNNGNRLAVAVTAPASPVSGDPVLYGQLPGVALVTKDATSGLTSCQFQGVAAFSVKGYNGSANTAIAEGDVVYYKAGATPVLQVDSSGVRFGIAMGAVASGATTTINVRIGY
jgi:predicted RecA/RadA family phage recombinase